MICITLGEGAEFCITNDEQMLIRKVVQGNVVSEVRLGRATEKRLDTMLLHMGSLRIHTRRGE